MKTMKKADMVLEIARLKNENSRLRDAVHAITHNEVHQGGYTAFGKCEDSSSEFYDAVDDEVCRQFEHHEDGGWRGWMLVDMWREENPSITPYVFALVSYSRSEGTHVEKFYRAVKCPKVEMHLLSGE